MTARFSHSSSLGAPGFMIRPRNLPPIIPVGEEDTHEVHSGTHECRCMYMTDSMFMVGSHLDYYYGTLYLSNVYMYVATL